MDWKTPEELAAIISVREDWIDGFPERGKALIVTAASPDVDNDQAMDLVEHLARRVDDLESRLTPLERLRDAVEALKVHHDGYIVKPVYDEIYQQGYDTEVVRLENAIDAALSACQSKPGDSGEGGTR